MSKQNFEARYFTSYSGVSLPLKLIDELDEDRKDKRITYFTAYYDQLGRIKIIDKIVYGEIEFSHHYEYDKDNVLEKAVLIEDDELPRTLLVKEQGTVLEAG